MSNWNASHYLKYGGERTRAAADLVARIRLSDPATIVDLGCGPGNSTQLLFDRWPNAEVVGVDSSADMIEKARSSFPEIAWSRSCILDWDPAVPVDLVFSNAALQWLPDHGALVQRLFQFVSEVGALAFQIPSRTFAMVRTLIHEVSQQTAWKDRMEGPRKALTMEYPSFYYDELAGRDESLDVWETEYHHVLDSQDAIVDWMAGTGLRPFLAALETEEEKRMFLNEVRERVRDSYEVRIDGKVLFPFRRTFVIAYR